MIVDWGKRTQHQITKHQKTLWSLPIIHHSLKCIDFNFDDMAIATAELLVRGLKF